MYVRMRNVDAPVPKASLWVSEANYEVYPPTDGRCRRQSIEWRRKAGRGEKDESEFNLPLVAFYLSGNLPPCAESVIFGIIPFNSRKRKVAIRASHTRRVVTDERRSRS